MTSREIELLADLAECNIGAGVLDSQFSEQERRLLRSLKAKGLADIVWQITPKGRARMEEGSIQN